MAAKPHALYPLITFRESEPLQAYYRDSNGDGYAVARLIDDTKDLKPFDAPLAALDLSGEIWRGADILELARHCQQVKDADLTKPIIISWNGEIADGRHRIIKAIMQGKNTIKAVRMTWKPEPCKKAEE